MRLKVIRKKTSSKKNKIKKIIIRGGNLRFSVKYGLQEVNSQKLTKEETSEEPLITFMSNKTKTYTIILWDPDAPFKPSWVHWIVNNITKEQDIYNTENELLSYNGPNPPSGTHRYFIGLFVQEEGHINPYQPLRRGFFDIVQFIKDYKLRPIIVKNFHVSSI
jgi:phosphatidylethanolamine-binding protein (PEBP) family uncharacterized protein